MKKFLLFIVFGLLAGMVSAQQVPTKQLSIDEANRLNGTPKEPTINGKPYSQYKAEQDALKKQKESNKSVNNPDATINLANAKQVVPKTKPVEPVYDSKTEYIQPGDNKLKPAPEKKVEAAVVKTETKQPAMTANQSARTAEEGLVQLTPSDARPAAAKAPVSDVRSDDPSSKQSPSNVVVVEEAKAVQESKMIRTEAVIQEKESVTQKPDATFTKAAQPQVPEQFKLNTSQSWTGRAATTQAATVKSDPAQPIGAVAVETYKTPSVPQSNKPAEDDGKRIAPDTKTVQASLVKAPAASSAAPLLPTNLNSSSVRDIPASSAPATVPTQNGPVAPGSVMGTPAEQNKPATEKPAKQN